MNAHIVRNYVKAVGLGSKYVYQAIPRMLTLWLDLGENPKTATHPIFSKIHGAICQAVESVPAYKVRFHYPDTYFSLAKPCGSGSRHSLKSCLGWDTPIKKCITSCQRLSARSSANTHTKRCGSLLPSSNLPRPIEKRVGERYWTLSGYVSFLHCTVVVYLPWVFIANTSEQSHECRHGAPDAHHAIARDDGRAAQVVQPPHRRRSQDAQHEARIPKAGFAGQVEIAHPTPRIAHCQSTTCIFDNGEFDTRAFSECSADVRG